MTAKIFRNAFLIGFTVLLACILLFFFIMYSNYQAQAYDILEVEAEHIAEGMQICGGEEYLAAMQSDERITWIAPDGSVLYDNMADADTMENHLQRPEVQGAFETGSGRSDRYSSTILEKNNYYARLLKDGTVLRVAGKQTSVAAMALMLVQPSLWIVVLVLVLCGLLAMRLAKQIVRPINAINPDNPNATPTYPELQPLIAYKKDMTPENVLDHVLASASFPGFQPTVIGDKKYLDGGLYDACPYNELLDYGCDEVIAIRLNGFGIIHPLRDKQKIRQIFPSEQLGPVMRFDPATSRRNIQMGYYDTMRFMRELPGQLYYFSEKADGFAAFAALPENAIKAAGIPLRLPEGLSPRRALFEHILPAVAAELRLPREAGYDDLLLALLEHRAEQLGIGRFRWYTPAQLQAVIAESTALPEEPRRPLLRSRPLEAAEILAAALPLLG